MKVYCPRCGAPAMLGRRAYIKSCGCCFLPGKMAPDEPTLHAWAEPWSEEQEVQRLRYLLPRLLRGPAQYDPFDEASFLRWDALHRVSRELEAKRG